MLPWMLMMEVAMTDCRMPCELWPLGTAVVLANWYIERIRVSWVETRGC